MLFSLNQTIMKCQRLTAVLPLTRDPVYLVKHIFLHSSYSILTTCIDFCSSVYKENTTLSVKNLKTQPKVVDFGKVVDANKCNFKF